MSRRKPVKPRAQAPQPAPPAPPEPRATFHVERNATQAGDYEIRITLSDSMPQYLIGKAMRPDLRNVEIARRLLSNASPIISDASKAFGVPAGLDPAVFREVLETCRQWVQDDARRVISSS